MTTPPDLSPDAQEVFWAFNSKFNWVEDGVPGPQFNAIAAAIREVVDRVIPENPVTCEAYTNEAIRLNLQGARSKLLAIAAELDGGPTT